jgi:hypothetical protein
MSLFNLSDATLAEMLALPVLEVAVEPKPLNCPTCHEPLHPVDGCVKPRCLDICFERWADA